MKLFRAESKAGVNYLTEREEKILFSFLKNRKDKQAERDYVLLRLCRATGLRRGEALALNVGDVLGKDRIAVDERIAEKGAIGEVYLPKDLQEVLRGLLRLKRNAGESLEDKAPLFVSRKGHRLSLRAFNDLMDKWCALAGLPRYTPHALRHTKAQRIMADVRVLTDEERRKALLLANRQLRHKSLNSTSIYLQPTKEEMVKVGAI
ncbi:MAG: tyrosine-type recombinase/integrase [Thermodesulfovibrionales bacterium]|nr:tyrosine-type recombinase/integrase [Thermodesulfovibrionales bacterium]